MTACLMNLKCDVMMHDVACAGTDAAKVSSVDVLSTQTTQNGMQAVTAKVQPPFRHALSLLCPGLTATLVTFCSLRHR